MELSALAGYDLGEHEIVYTERDTMLYAVAVGATSEHLDLVYERDLVGLPSFACALGLWAVEAAGELGAYDRKRSLHASQALEMHGPMPPCGPIASTARISGVWDKGKAAVVDIEVESAVFTATYGIFLPGLGGFGGERGPSSGRAEAPEFGWQGHFTTLREQATLYRLTGDLHPIHIDPEVARANGFDRPILHGLCTLGIAAREIAEAAGAHPASLSMLEARLAAPVMPGDTIAIDAGVGEAGEVHFMASVGDSAVLKGGRARFEDA